MSEEREPLFDDEERKPEEESAPKGKIVPLFPLPDIVLFPGQIQPLHIFEARYRQMVRDLLDSSGELAIGTVLGDDKARLGETAPVQEVAGLGRLEQYRALPDGRFLVIVLGVKRAVVRPLAGDHLYPVCEIDPVPLEQEVIVDPIARARYEGRLRDALEDCWEEEEPPPDGMPLFQLADLLQMHLPLTAKKRYEIFSTRPLEQRIRDVLAEAGREKS